MTPRDPTFAEWFHRAWHAPSEAGPLGLAPGLVGLGVAVWLFIRHRASIEGLLWDGAPDEVLLLPCALAGAFTLAATAPLFFGLDLALRRRRRLSGGP